MPELPEVETIRAGLASHVSGRDITSVSLLWPGCVARPSPEDFGRHLTGRRIEAVERRGKFLVFRLDGGSALSVHLRMTGRLLLVASDTPPAGHARAILSLDGGNVLQFEDQRKFGRLYLTRTAGELDAVLGALGPEPLEGAFSPEALRELLRGRRATLKPLLLNQAFLAGLGNIYVDEALFRARLHPLRRTDTLSGGEIDRLHEGIIGALRQGIANRGTTLSDYRDAWGTAGLNRERLLVFRRQGQPCAVCGVPIQKARVAQRGTHYCPHCQPSPARL